jgi:hypothetical protein
MNRYYCHSKLKGLEGFFPREKTFKCTEERFALIQNDARYKYLDALFSTHNYTLQFQLI